MERVLEKLQQLIGMVEDESALNLITEILNELQGEIEPSPEIPQPEQPVEQTEQIAEQPPPIENDEDIDAEAVIAANPRGMYTN